jgi:hypothetical protein
MRRALPAVAILLVLGQAAGARAQQPLPIDGIVRLLLKVEQLMQAGNPDAYMDLLSVVATRGLAQEAARTLISPGITRAVIRERDRSPLEGTLPGDGYRLMVEVFIERGAQARIATWRLDIRRVPTDASQDEWRIAGQEQLTTLEALSRLTLNPSKQYRARNLVVRDGDLEIRLDDGFVFVAEIPSGPTAAVLVPVQGGTMHFRPAPEVEREQVRIYAGTDTIDARYDAVFMRLNASDFPVRFPAAALTPGTPEPEVFQRADEIFRADVGKSYGLELADLSRETWSIEPLPGELLAEIHTRRFQTLTYARSANEPEDVSLFDRRRRRNISVYASPQHVAAGSRNFDQEERSAYEVTNYQLDVAFDPERVWLDGRALLRLRITADAVNHLTIRLAETLTTRSVYSSEFGRLLALRVRGQNNIVVNLPGFVTRGTELNLTVTYSGRLEPAVPDRETAAPQFPAETQVLTEASTIPAEPSLLYSTRAYWYPQAVSGAYGAATMHLTVPEPYQVLASGELAPGSPVVVPAQERHRTGRLYTFETRQPVRYLACLISRFSHVDTRTVSLVEALGSLAAASGTALPADPVAAGSFNSEIDLVVEANPRQINRGRALSPVLADMMAYYASVVGDSPYSTLTLALIENNLPGGHSPAYLAILNQPLPTANVNWSSDPAAFPAFPEYFLAHETAHQWWGQAVGWRNYHDQWISEGFAQYFAALYARKSRGDGLFFQMLRRMAQWARDQGDAGPVSLGYRLGHIQGNSRIFRAIVYNKSASVLHMLRRIVGDDAFFRGVRRLYFGSRFRKAGSDDVRAAFEREGGRPLEAFFDSWIEGSGTPQVAVSWAPARDVAAPAVVVRVEQRGKLYEFPVTVTLRYASGTQQDTQIVVRERVGEFTIPLSGSLKNVTLNRDGLTPLDIVGR